MSTKPGQLHSFAEVPARLAVGFQDGNAISVTVYFGESEFKSVMRSLRAKYGEPTVLDETGEEHLQWGSGDISLEAKRRIDEPNWSSAQLTSKAGIAAWARKRDLKAAAAAKDL